MFQVERMNALMGGAILLKITSIGDLAERVAEGLSKAALRNTARHLFDSLRKRTI